MSSKPNDIESLETEDRKFGQRKYRNCLLKEGEGPQSEGYGGEVLTIALTKETLLPFSSAYLYTAPEPQDCSYVLEVCSHTRQKLAAVAQFIAWSKYFDSLENNLSKAEVKSIRCVKF